MSKAAKGLGEVDLILKGVPLWVRCYQIALRATEKSLCGRKSQLMGRDFTAVLF